MRKLEAKLQSAQHWQRRHAELFEKKPTIRDANVLCSEAEAAGLTMPALTGLKASIATARTWLEQSRRLQARSTRGVVSRASVVETQQLYMKGQALVLDLPEVHALAVLLQEAAQWSERAEEVLALADKEAISMSKSVGRWVEAKAEFATASKDVRKPKLPIYSTMVRSRLRELIVQVDSISLSVGLALTLRLRSWRQEVVPCT